MGQVPGATRALRVLRVLAAHPGPVPLDRVARDVGLPRSSAYHLLAAMIEEGFVVHLPEERCYGLGMAAFEVGSGYVRQEPLQRIARRPLAALADETGEATHLAVLHGSDVLYLIDERPPGRPPLVSEVGVRLPASVTASGRAMLAALPASQVRAIYAEAASFTQRAGRGPTRLSELRRLLGRVRADGYALEEGEVTPGLATIARAVLDYSGYPVAAVAVTFPIGETIEAMSDRLDEPLRATAAALSARLGRQREATATTP